MVLDSRRKDMNAMRSGAAGRALQLPLGRLALCLDCDTCFELGADPCPACGGRVWASVARFLDRRHTP